MGESIQEFAVIATGDQLLSEEFADALFEATGGDASLEVDRRGEIATIWFDRESPTMKQAVVSAIHQLAQIEGLQIKSVELDDIVTQDQIADRVGVSRQTVSMHINQTRGAKTFPLPAIGIPGYVRVWRLADVLEHFDYTEEAYELRAQREEVDSGFTEAFAK